MSSAVPIKHTHMHTYIHTYTNLSQSYVHPYFLSCVPPKLI